jgi:HK97 family phage major capsid protein
MRAAVTGNTAGMSDFEKRAMSESFSGAEGGYIVPAPLSNEVLDLARAQAVVFRAGARTIPMDSMTLRIARVEQDVGPGWKAELYTVPEQDMVLGSLELKARTLVGKIYASVELIEHPTPRS